MVVGVHKSLEEGRTYSYAELRDRFGLAGPDLERVLDRLVERGRLKPVLFRRVQQAGRATAMPEASGAMRAAGSCRAPSRSSWRRGSPELRCAR